MANNAVLIAKTEIKRKQGHLYFIGKDGNVYETKMARGRKKKQA